MPCYQLALFLLPTSPLASLGWSGRYRRLPPCITLPNYVNRLGTWNERGINDTTKREEAVDIFKEGKLELLALTETKLKGKREVSWSEVNIIFACIQEMERAREGVAVLLNDVWHSAVVKSGYVSSKILWTKLKFSRVKVCVVVGYSHTEGDGEEWNRFWNDMDRTG